MKAESEGDGATLELGIKPDLIKTIPEERDRRDRAQDAVRREVRRAATSRRTRPPKASQAGDKIDQTKMPIEVERVLNDLYPLLRTVQPAELNYTLNALATPSRAAATRSARASRRSTAT